MLITTLLLFLLVGYALLFGATYNGILDARLRLASLVVLGLTLAFWLWRRGRRRWRWPATPLDGAILVWAAAFALSLLANADAWRRIAIGLWYVGLYVVVWYVLRDVFANGGLRRVRLIDALLVAGVPAVFFGWSQVMANGLQTRPVGTLGNANALASLLVMLLPLCAGRLRAAKTPLWRTLLGFYGLTLFGLLLLSFSRGGWIGAAVGLALWAALSLPLRRWWAALRRPLRGLLLLTAVLGLAAGLYVGIDSLGIGGRGLDLRAFLYETALRLFAEKPLTGTGLFTFGAGLSRLNSIPPVEPHSHAHNVILHVGAELGVVGLLALALTAWAFLRVLPALRRSNDAVGMMSAAAFAGFAAHQLFDLPAMMPALALVALVTLALALHVPVSATEPASMSAPRWRERLLPPLVTALALALLVTGFWSALNYREYVAALSDAVGSGDYATGAARLQALTAADPELAIYHEERGMLLGLAAAQGDLTAAQAAADSFRRYVALEPSYVSGWANLAALELQLGRQDEALAAVEQALTLAPRSAPIAFRAGVYFEAAGQSDAARAAYAQAAALDPDRILVPGWNDSPLRQGLGDESRLSLPAQIVRLLERGDVQAAQAAWDAFPERTTPIGSIEAAGLLLSRAQGDQSQAASWLAALRRDAASAEGRAWAHLGAALLDPAQFDAEIAAARAALEPAPTAADTEFDANIAYIQYLHLAIPRLFLPQFGYSEAESLLLHLLSDDALVLLRPAAANP